MQCGAPLAQGGTGESTTVILKGGGEEITTDDELPEGTADAHAGVVESLPAGSALLVIQRGPNAGSRFLLERDVTTVGRHPDRDIFLDDITVSRRHVEFHREGGGFSLQDSGSLNGTYVNRKPVDVAKLAGGDEVQVGKFRFAAGVPSSGCSSAAAGEGGGARRRRTVRLAVCGSSGVPG